MGAARRAAASMRAVNRWITEGQWRGMALKPARPAARILAATCFPVQSVTQAPGRCAPLPWKRTRYRPHGRTPPMEADAVQASWVYPSHGSGHGMGGGGVHPSRRRAHGIGGGVHP